MMLTLSAFLRIRIISTTILLLALVFSFSACARRARQKPLTTQPKANDQQSGRSPQAADAANQTNAQLININTAPVGELEKLPGIGKGLATRIIEHREKWGAFRRPEHLIAVRGISDRRFRALRDLITVE
jgi:competence ComEA-like helix-hairpin-helix protein